MPRVEPQNIDAENNALGCAFLSKSAVDKICEELSKGVGSSTLAKKYNCGSSTIIAIKNRKSYTDISDNYNF